MTANLPTNYVSAKQALQACSRVDECKAWADKALALASYARQMKDESLENEAKKIRARAVQRGGELLVCVQASKSHQRLQGSQSPSSRKAVAKAAGLSPDQAKQMIRVANVPHGKFEAMVERSNPATIEQLAEAGTKKKPKAKPEPYRNEWLDWTQAVQQIAAVPDCGLQVLAVRVPEENKTLQRECAKAMNNLRQWSRVLEKYHVKTKGNGKSAGCNAVAD